MKLIKSKEYHEATQEERDKISNGCGAKGMIDFVPDQFMEFDMSEACDIHDWDYTFAGPTDEAKHICDQTFLFNLVVLALRLGKKHLSRRLRLCLVYYDAVVSMGSVAFWAGKNKPEPPHPIPSIVEPFN